MPKDKYTALWLSYSSINDYLKCPRAYFINNVYRNPKTGNKVTLITPPLALGQAVHELIESLSILPVKKRFEIPLVKKFEQFWEKVRGRRGGFISLDEEYQYKKRGLKMISQMIRNPGPLKKLAVKIKMNLPYYWLSEKDNIILCGKIDWLEYLPKTDSVHIIDFKTSRKAESQDSLQLPIYQLLAHNCQKRRVTKASYWYLDQDDGLVEINLSDLEKSSQKILKIAKEIKLARQLERFVCPKKNGCFYCRPLEKILSKEAQFVGINDFSQEVYTLKRNCKEKEDNSIII